MLATTINSNVGAHLLSPMATEIEKKTIKWLADFIGVSSDCGGLFVSGGIMANFTAFLAARKVKVPKSIKEIVDIIVKLGRKIHLELI
jgi:aromatic-L-amino-acid decarboxylase